MKTLRSHLVWALMAGTLVIMGPFYIVWNLFTPDGYRSYPLSVLWIKICTLWMGLKIRATGRENLPQAGTCILMPNHRSWWDIPTVQIGAYPHQVRFVSKKEVGKIPLLGTCMTGGGHVLIDRGDRDSAVRTLRDAAARYKGRISLVLFPEGTRSPGHHLLRFKRGGFHLARELGLSIVPVSVAGGERIMKKGSLTILPGTMRVHYHAPIPVPKDADLNVISAAVREKIAAGLREMGEYEEEGRVGKGEGASASGGGEEPRDLILPPGKPGDHLRSIAIVSTVLFAASLLSGGDARAIRLGSELFDLLGVRTELRIEQVISDSLKQDVHDVIRLDPAARLLTPPGDGELGLVTAIKNEPARAATLIDLLGASMLNSSESRSGRLAGIAASQLGYTADDSAIDSRVASAWNRSGREGSLAEAISTFYGGGKRLSGNQRDALRRTAPEVPPGLARIAAFLLFAHVEAAELHRKAFEGADLARERLDRKNFDLDVMAWVDTLGDVPDRVEESLIRASRGIDWPRLLSGAVLLDKACDRAAEELEELPAEELGWTGRFVWDSPVGRILLGGAGNSEYRGPHLLLIELEGDDVYTGVGGARYPTHPVSILIDRVGNDRFAPADSTGPGVGGALGGYSFVADLAGNDDWRSYRLGLGSACFGVAVVRDWSGEDTYESLDFSQGAAAWGIGLLCDRRGNDRYTIRRAGQGFGGPHGVGVLLETGESKVDSGDVYVALPVASDSLSPGWSPRGGSFIQGAGVGVRRGSLGAANLAGGIGLLIDGRGNDHYTGTRLSQGVGHRDGLGAMLDWYGDDTYMAEPWSRAVGTDGGVGLHRDKSGADRYGPGGGNSFAVDLGMALFFDGHGDDQYIADRTPKSTAFAFAIRCGLALFVDEGGSDLYDGSAAFSPGSTVEWGTIASRIQRRPMSTAIFLDLDGEDTYRGFGPEVGDRKRWGMDDGSRVDRPFVSIGLDVNGLPPE